MIVGSKNILTILGDVSFEKLFYAIEDAQVKQQDMVMVMWLIAAVPFFLLFPFLVSAFEHGALALVHFLRLLFLWINYTHRWAITTRPGGPITLEQQMKR